MPGRRDCPATMQIMLSMLEVYNEKVRDLLPSRQDSGKELKIRERPSGKGKAKQIYVAGLKSYTVGAYKEIEELLNIAMKNRCRLSACLVPASLLRAVYEPACPRVQQDYRRDEDERDFLARAHDLDAQGPA